MLEYIKNKLSVFRCNRAINQMASDIEVETGMSVPLIDRKSDMTKIFLFCTTLIFCFFVFAIMFRWQIVPVSAGAGAGAGASDEYSGSTEVNVETGAYRLDRWTGDVTYYDRNTKYTCRYR